MAQPASEQALQDGHDALARGAWTAARDAFQRSIHQRESAEALEGLGLAGWWLDASDLVFDARERAYRLYREAGDVAGAARMAVWLAWDTAAFRGEAAVAGGWLQRARRLLEDQPEGVEHAWLALRAGLFALLDDNDPEAAEQLASEAIRIGQAIGAVDHELVGRALHGFASVTAGKVADGLRELDEVNAAVLAGEVRERMMIGLACCYLIAACERIHDYDRAVQWCDRLKAQCEKWQFRPLFAVCRTQYASVCMWRGAWEEAEHELTSAAEELAAARPAMVGEGLARLGELRRRQGRLDEAVALFDRCGGHPLASVGRARVAYDRGDFAAAADLSERHLRRLPVQNRTERADSFEVLIRSRLAGERLAEAEESLEELSAIAGAAGTAPLRAVTALARGLIACHRNEMDQARTNLEDAVDLYQESGAPFETARAQIDLARVLAALGRSDAAIAQARQAFDTLKPLGAAVELGRAQEIIDRHSEAPAAPPKSPLTGREIEVLRLIAEGANNTAIASRLFISEHTVHRHVANMLTKLDVPSRSAAVAQATRLGLL